MVAFWFSVFCFYQLVRSLWSKYDLSIHEFRTPGYGGREMIASLFLVYLPWWARDPEEGLIVVMGNHSFELVLHDWVGILR